MRKKSNSGTSTTAATSTSKDNYRISVPVDNYDIPQEVSSFRPTDICAIIEQCHKSGVRDFNYQGLCLGFGPKKPIEIKNGPKISLKEMLAGKANEKEALEAEEFRTRQEQLSYLRLADPEAYEELLSKGELENAGKEPQGIEA